MCVEDNQRLGKIRIFINFTKLIDERQILFSQLRKCGHFEFRFGKNIAITPPINLFGDDFYKLLFVSTFKACSVSLWVHINIEILNEIVKIFFKII